MTIGIATSARSSVPGTATPRDRQAYPARPRPAPWPETPQPRPALVERLSNPPSPSGSADVRRCMRRGLAALLGWLEHKRGRTWQGRWLASGSEAECRAGTDLV